MTPGSGHRPTGRRIELLVAGIVGAGLLGVTAFLGSLVVAAMTATGAVGAGTSLWVLLALLVTVLATGVAAAGAAAWLAWLGLAQLRTATVSGWRRVLWTGYRRARTFEERSLLGRVLRPARLFEARGDDEGHLVEELKARYVTGEVDEPTFERELGRLLGGRADDARPVRREIEVTAADGGVDPDGRSTPESAPGAGEDGGRPEEPVEQESVEHESEDTGPERDAETA